jgi:hypothetical protein
MIKLEILFALENRVFSLFDLEKPHHYPYFFKYKINTNLYKIGMHDVSIIVCIKK